MTWPVAGAAPEATVTIDYRHPLTVTEHACDLTPRYGADYDDLVERCFFNYVRLYVPSGSVLLDTSGFQADSVRTTRGEKGTQVFGGYFVMLPGEHLRVQFRYQLPATLAPERYQLLVQRQSGSGPLPITLNMNDRYSSLSLEANIFYWSDAQ